MTIQVVETDLHGGSLPGLRERDGEVPLDLLPDLDGEILVTLLQPEARGAVLYVDAGGVGVAVVSAPHHRPDHPVVLVGVHVRDQPRAGRGQARQSAA